MMEFEFNVNLLFQNSISVFDKDLHLHQDNGDPKLQRQLGTVIDAMGIASAKAQGLGGAITTASKLKYSDHHLYIMKESHANSDKGSVVGILKVGRKVLFVLDHHSNQIEMNPMCVLDFYVHESCQRRGYGKQLFQHMLSCERIEPQHLAIDRPSKKFTSFLMKHYRLRATIHQVNNFVIFEGFFKNQPDNSYPRRRSSHKPPLPPSTAASRVGNYRNASDASLWGHKTGGRPASESGSSRERAALQNIRPRSGSCPSSRDSPTFKGSQGDLDLTTRGLNYSRHHRSATPPSRPGSGKNISTTSPITGDVTSVTNSSPAKTIARIPSWEDSLLKARLPLREHNSPPIERLPSRGAPQAATPPTNENSKGTIRTGRPNPGQGHIVDTIYNGLSTPVSSSIPAMQSSRIPSGSASATHPTNATNDIPTAATNHGATKDAHSSGSWHITKEGNYCMTSYVPREMPSSWNVMGIPPSTERYSNGQSSGLYRSSSYRTNRFF